MSQNSDTKAIFPKQKLSAMTVAFIENSATIKKFLRRYLRCTQDIDDVVQEAYLKAYAAEQKGSIRSPKSYLYSIAKNIAINELTNKSNQVTHYLEECENSIDAKPAATLEDEIEAHQEINVYCEAVAALPPACRRVFILRKVHGLKQSEIADTLGVTLRNVELHLQHGTLRCREFIRKSQENVPSPNACALESNTSTKREVV